MEGESLFGKVLRKLRGRKPLTAAADLPPEPVAEILARGRRVALVSGWPKDGDAAWVQRTRKNGAEVDVLPLFQPYIREDGRAMAFVYTPPREAYDAIVVDIGIDLYEHSWSYAFLDRLNSLLDDKGALLLAKTALPLARLEQLFGRAPAHAGKRYITFDKAKSGLARPSETPISTLDAYWALMDKLVYNRFEPEIAKVIGELGGAPLARPAESRRDLVNLLQRQCYRTTGVRGKAAMVQYLAELYFPGRHDLHLLDLGAGTGLNTLELLLSDTGVSALTLVDVDNEIHHWAIATAYDWLRAHLRGKVSLVTGRAETYEGRPADIALISGVFAIIANRGTHAPIMQRAWDSLLPGGILIVYENLKDTTSDGGDGRLTAEELDGMMGCYAPVRYFTPLRERTREDVGSTAVFRAIRKPLA